MGITLNRDEMRYLNLFLSGISFILIFTLILGGNMIKNLLMLDSNSAANNLVFNSFVFVPIVGLSFVLSIVSIFYSNKRYTKRKLEYLFIYFLAFPGVILGFFVVFLLVSRRG